MKLQDISNAKIWLEELRDFANKQDYNTFTYINQRLVKLMPILELEYNRLKSDNLSVNCPQIYIFTNRDALNANMTVQDYMNLKLKDFVNNDFTIMDFGKLDETFEDDNSRTIYFYIKYSN